MSTTLNVGDIYMFDFLTKLKLSSKLKLAFARLGLSFLAVGLRTPHPVAVPDHHDLLHPHLALPPPRLDLLLRRFVVHDVEYQLRHREHHSQPIRDLS